MQVQNVSFNGCPVKINPNSKMNKGKKYLYNEVLDIVRDNQITTEFHTNYIQLSDAIKAVLNKLKEKNIEYIHVI